MAAKTDPVTRDLAKESAAAADLLRQIATEDEEFQHDIIEGETSLLEAIDAAISEIDDCEIIATGCAEKIDQIKSRKDRAEKRKDRIRAALEQALVVSGRKDAKTATATLTVKDVPPKILSVDEAKIPAKYFVPQPPKLDRTALNKALKTAKHIAGVTMTNGGITLQIRRA